MLIRSREVRANGRPVGPQIRPRWGSPHAHGLIGWFPVQVGWAKPTTGGLVGSPYTRNLVGPGDGQATSGTTMVPDPLIGPMWDFNGGIDFFILSGAPDPAGSPVTIAFWVETTTTAFSVLWGWYDGGSPFSGFGIAINLSGANGFLNYWGGNGAGSWKEGNVAVNDGVRHHCAITVNGTAVAFFVDGRPAGTAVGQQPTTFTGSKRFGSAVDGGGATTAGFIGKMADLRLHNQALSPEAIWSMFAPATRWDLYDTGPIPAMSFAAAGGGGAARSRTFVVM